MDKLYNFLTVLSFAILMLNAACWLVSINKARRLRYYRFRLDWLDAASIIALCWLFAQRMA